MPKLWSRTIEEHRRDVRAALLETTAALVARQGLRGVTMSQIADETGIGRATLYKYFPSVESILIAWHESQVADHLERLASIRNGPGEPFRRLEAVLEAYALHFERHGAGIAAMLHQGEHMARAEQHLRAMLAELLGECVKAGRLRSDVPPRELAAYCIHALTAAGDLQSRAAVHRLVSVTLAGLSPR